MRTFLFSSLVALSVSTFAIGNDYAVNVVELAPQHTAVIGATVKSTEEVGAKFAEIFPAVWEHLQQKGIAPVGAPFSRYFRFEPGTAIEFEGGFPIANATQAAGPVTPGFLPGGTTATTIHVGPFEQIGAAYEALHAWITANQKEVNGAPWEVYVNDPSTVPPEEYQTQIFFPIK